MKAAELRKKSLEELKILEKNLIKESFNLQMQKATGQLDKPNNIKKTKKDIARIYTVITEKGNNNG